MPQTPGIGYPPSSSTSLWRDIATNFFEIAQSLGYNGQLEPNALDNATSSMRKVVVYTAYIADNI